MQLLSTQYKISKARSSERQRLAQLLAAQERRMRQAFITFAQNLRSKPMISQIRELLANSNMQGALKLVDQHVAAFGRVIPQLFVAIALDEAKTLAAKAGFIVKAAPRFEGEIAIGFDPSNPRAARLMQAAQLSFVQQITNSQRAAIRVALASSFGDGSTSLRDYTQAFVGALGLTQAQVEAVNNYRTLLETGSTEALARDLRDRRYDRSVVTAFDTGEPLEASQIDRMVDRYATNMLNYRAEMIARTEGLGILSQARQEAMAQVIDQAGFDPDTVRRTWRTTLDGRERDSHHDMDGQTVGLNEPFITPSGDELMYPGDPSAPAKERINCRCQVTTEFD